MKRFLDLKFYIFFLKKNILSIIFVLFTVSLILFSNSNLLSAKNGLLLWANSVVPSLFSFFVATELLTYTNVIYILGKSLNFIMRPIFNVPGIGSFPFIMGIISGYPSGAKIVCNLKEKKLCTPIEAERLLAFTNNSGPLFIVGTIGIVLFGNIEIVILLLVTHILACISVGLVFRFWKFKESQLETNLYVNFNELNNTNIATFNNLGKILSSSISSATHSIFIIGGFVVLFSVIISILNNSGLLNILTLLIEPIFKLLKINPEFGTGFISGIIELTNGLNIIANIPEKKISINIIICAFLLGFGGFSVVLQVLSIVSEADISIKPYILGKLLQGIFAGIYTYLLIYHFPIFNLNI
jgi:sporulation integral membrane protein YlbJ